MPQLPPLPPVADAPLSVILLAVGGGNGAKAVVAGWADFLAAFGRSHELIVAAGAEAADRFEELRGHFPALVVVRVDGPAGDGSALRVTLPHATHPLLFYTVCDPAYRPADLRRLLERRLPEPPGAREIDHTHLVSGYRAGRTVPAVVRAVEWGWRLFCRAAFGYWPTPLPGWLGWRGHAGWLLARVAFGLRSRDVACPFRLMRRDILRRIPLQSDGAFVHVEILAKANFLGCVLAEEYPLDVPARPDPNSGGMLREGWRLFNRPDFGPTFLPGEPAPSPPGEAAG